MIVFKIQGGLCNQLFQWAYAYKLSKSQELYIDNSFYGTQFLETLVTNREFQLNEILNKELQLLDNQSYQKLTRKPVQRIVDNFHFGKHNFSAESLIKLKRILSSLRSLIISSFSDVLLLCK